MDAKKVCRSCQQQFWGRSASASNSAHQGLAQQFRDLMPMDLFKAGSIEEAHEDGAKLEHRSAVWMEDQFRDCLL